MTKVGIFAHLHGGSGGPDGLALDEGGNLLVCHTGTILRAELETPGLPMFSHG